VGDYTQGTVKIRGGVPTEQAEEVRKLLNDAGFGWDDRDEYDRETWRLIRRREDSEIDWSAGDFTAESCTGDAAEQVVSDILELCPEVRICAQTDPAYEWLGLLAMATPELGRYDAECDANGNPLFRRTEILEWVNEAQGPFEQPGGVVGYLFRKMGGPWVEALFPQPEEVPA
jgi:hypothetical protein